MTFAVIKKDVDARRDAIAGAIVGKFLEHGFELSPPEAGVKFVLNLTDTEAPRAFRRAAQSVIVFSLVVADAPPAELRGLCYRTLVRSLSNVVLCAVPKAPAAGEDGSPAYEMYFTTPESGFYHMAYDPEGVFRRIAPIAGARFAIGNQFSADLPPRLWCTSPTVEALKRHGAELDTLGLLPTPFPLHDFLDERSIRHIYKLFEMRGLSYGNLSARERVPELGEATFWMTARGVNKACLTGIGRDILLVKGFDVAGGRALVSVPPVHDERARVSVDAVEHELIYRTFPRVGAIVHVHAWMEDIPCTSQNYPCGTFEIAEDVVSLLKRTSGPERTIVGLKNHGLTITGPSLEDIFGRIRGCLQTEVRMAV
jgi:ribulose-5-phosphate 4-epimerase/fuculose-1-phosphate aldolase